MNKGADSAKERRKVDRRPPADRSMTMQYADVNGIRIAYGVRGSGPPLVLIMGYRLSSLAWPRAFIEALPERFTLVLFDNRGTGASDKPTCGYEISNMARDVGGLLDHLEIARANIQRVTAWTVGQLMFDDELRARLGRQARSLIEREFSKEIQARRFVELYRETLDKSRPIRS